MTAPKGVISAMMDIAQRVSSDGLAIIAGNTSAGQGWLVEEPIISRLLRNDAGERIIRYLLFLSNRKP